MNIYLCHSIQNKKNLNIQCCNKPKNNEILCGVHINAKNVILFKDHMNESALIDKKDDLNKIIYTKEVLFEKILNNDYLSVYSIRNSIKNCYLNNIINTKKSKCELINELKIIIEKDRYYMTNIHNIIVIQKYYRKHLVQMRKRCHNDHDILTFTLKYDIPMKYFYIFNDVLTGKKYAYDIRTLIEIINSDYPSCPYTFRSFTDHEKDMIYLYQKNLMNRGVNLNMDKKVLTFEEETDMKIKDVFYQINMLDNYTNHLWFKNLSINELIELYILMEDIWNYRSNMELESKKRIVENGNVFNIPLNIIRMQKSKIKMQNIILNEFLRLINEGINREEKKLGAILILTGLVEVSCNAADALPHLMQI